MQRAKTSAGVAVHDAVLTEQIVQTPSGESRRQMVQTTSGPSPLARRHTLFETGIAAEGRKGLAP